MKKRTKGRKTAKVPPEKQKAVPPRDDEEKPFDFGGIPDRDLKKNLGCG